MDMFDNYFVEIMMVMRRYHGAAARLERPEDILRLRREENEALAEIVRQQGRALAHMAGEAVEPMQHYATAVINGQGGF